MRIVINKSDDSEGTVIEYGHIGVFGFAVITSC